MSLRTTLLTLLALAGAAALVFHLLARQLSRAWFAFGVHPEVVAIVEDHRDDQKRLARLDPPREPEYRERFAAAQTLLARLRVLEYSRRDLVRRYEATLLGAVLGVVVLAAGVYAVRQGRQEVRLARLQSALADLAAGRTDVRTGVARPARRGPGRGDLIGRIAAMVEETSRVMARDRRRLASLENLSAWQESARRHAHEIRTPLAAARLELGRVRDLVPALPQGAREELGRLQESLGQELERLAAFTQRFTSFARLPLPAPARHDLGALAGDFADLFAAAWPELTVRYLPPRAGRVEALVDPELLRQVLVNLGDNSAQALREARRGRGTLTLAVTALPEGIALDVTDDGPGIPPALRARLFEPYVTSRRVGEGMGLGLAIARKILLDHGGDLELVATSEAGTTFRLLFPRPPAAEAA